MHFGPLKSKVLCGGSETAAQVQRTTVDLAAVHLDALSLENLTQVSIHSTPAVAGCFKSAHVSHRRHFVDHGGEGSACCRSSRFLRVDLGRVYSGRWISSVSSQEWLLLLRRAQLCLARPWPARHLGRSRALKTTNNNNSK